MAESNREPPLCPCGFWGSTQTSGLCSKCYKEMLKRKECSSNSTSASAPSNPVKVVVTPASPNHPPTNSSLSLASHSPTKWPNSKTDPEVERSRVEVSEPRDEKVPLGDLASRDLDATSEASRESSSEVLDERIVETLGARSFKNKDLDSVMEVLGETEKSTDTTPTDEGGLFPERSIQKNKKKCFKCRCRLDLAACELGRCKCDYIFCELHRLPEQHDCCYDHKGIGRQEARQKMVSPKKQVGTSLKRLDSDS